MTNTRTLISRNKREGKYKGKRYKMFGNRFLKVRRRTERWEELFVKFPPKVIY
jgi:hypothetical protein